MHYFIKASFLKYFAKKVNKNIKTLNFMKLCEKYLMTGKWHILENLTCEFKFGG